MSSSDLLSTGPCGLSVDIDDPQEQDDVIGCIHEGDLCTIPNAWNARLATISTDVDDATHVSKKELTKKQKRRIEKYRDEIARLNTAIDALNHYFTTWFKKFETGEIGREQLVTNIVVIDSMIRMHENRRDVIRLQLDQLNVN